jgi:endoglucanase
VTSGRQILGGALGALAGALSPAPARGAPADSAIRVGQVGYRPVDRKLALVATSPARFAVVDSAHGTTVFEGIPYRASARDPASGDQVTALDFTAVRGTGRFVVTAPGVLPSPPFRIAPEVFDEPLRIVLKSFGWQRCGVALAGGDAWSHPPCHMADAVPWGGGARRDVTGGWHDSGDYGKYVPPAAHALWHLFRVQALPGRRNAELLGELRWELDWLLRMQRDDGAVHHKVGPARWTGDRLPHEDREPRFLFDVSSAATADLAAVAAGGMRLFQSGDPLYARRLRERAEAAWRWLGRHPATVPPGGFRNPPDVDGSGAYDDDDDRDERFWAAVELWRATGEGTYRTPVMAGLRGGSAFQSAVSWRNVQNLALLSLLEPGSPLPGAARAGLVASLDAHARQLLAMVTSGGYRAALGPRDYYWGSNGLALERAVGLLAAHRETGETRFQDAALDQLHYVLGRNALGKSFVTGLGADPPRRPYHQPSLSNARRLVLPGLMVGGPNALGSRLPVALPARAYRDDDRLYEVNEPSIYWTAALAHVLAALPSSGHEEAFRR